MAALDIGSSGIMRKWYWGFSKAMKPYFYGTLRNSVMMEEFWSNNQAEAYLFFLSKSNRDFRHPAAVHKFLEFGKDKLKDQEDGSSLKQRFIDVAKSLLIHVINFLEWGNYGRDLGTVFVTPARSEMGRAPRESVLITRGHAPVQPPANPAPQPAPELEFTFGIRGVAVFYPSHAAARRLGMAEPHILASRNALRVLAWMYGEPFEGQD
ncbi:hypothetical protein K438DRAFT_1780764 [Mycena galopus ATCC 62051]|nr:hypothetical protein K438DRAFT_1780764 [Mycena galopus ATCC 62051]